MLRAVDGHDPAAIDAALTIAKASDKPTLICLKTVIGFGSPNLAGSAKTHGSALGAVEIAATRVALNWPHAPFVVPADVLATWRAAGDCVQHGPVVVAAGRACAGMAQPAWVDR